MNYGVGLVLVVGVITTALQLIARRFRWSRGKELGVAVPAVLGSALIYALIHVLVNRQTIDFG